MPQGGEFLFLSDEARGPGHDNKLLEPGKEERNAARVLATRLWEVGIGT